MPYGDESFKLIVNTTAPAENTPQELVPFFDYINRMEVPKDDAFIKALHAQVEKYNTSEWRRKLMTLEERIELQIEMERARSFAEGEQKGLIEGETKARLENARKMKEIGFDMETISGITGLPIGEVEAL